MTCRSSGPSTATSLLTNAASRCIILVRTVTIAYSKCLGHRAATGHQRTLGASALHFYLNAIRKTTAVSGRRLNHRTPAKPPVSVFDAADYCSPFIKDGRVFVAKHRETKEHTDLPGLAQSRMLWDKTFPLDKHGNGEKRKNASEVSVTNTWTETEDHRSRNS